MLRPQPSAAVASAVLLGIAAVACRPARSATAATRLWIESLTSSVVVVHVSGTPPGLSLGSGRADGSRPSVVALTPTVVRIADSVRTLHVSVLGRGAVRLRFAPGGPLQEPGTRPWGRDITLTRGPDGLFHPVWRVHELVP